MTLFQTTYNYYIFDPGRVQNLEATGPLGSLMRPTDPLDGEMTCCAPSSRTSNRFQSCGLNFWLFGPRAQIDPQTCSAKILKDTAWNRILQK